MIVILTYGKVSSISLRSVLQRQFPGDVFYTHGRQPELMKVVEEFCAAVPERGAPMKAEAFIDNPEIDRRLALAHATGEPVAVLVGIRDPIARSVSASLQVLETFFPECQTDTDEGTAERLAEALTAVWSQGGRGLDPVGTMVDVAIRAPFDWLQTEIEQPFGFDLLAEAFDTGLGYRVYVRGQVSLLLYRQENAPGAIEAGLAQLFPPHLFRLPLENITNDKGQEGLYTALKRRFRLPAETLDVIYGNPYVSHFMSPDEISAAKARWTATAPQPSPL